MTLATDLVEWTWSLDVDRIPAEVQRAALRHMLDGLGCALGAARLGEARAATAVAEALGGPGEATVIGGARRLPAPGAALANGTLVHALDFDDTHAGALVHATAAVLPAALAVGEETAASGAAVLAAAVAGYETVVRLGAAVRHGFHARGFHATSVCGTYAAALVAARLAGLDRRTAVQALGIAGSFASGSLEFLADGSSTKQLHPGWAGHAGIVAARLAAAGATGPDTTLEGASGLFRSYTGTVPAPEVVTGGLGGTWETTRITIKPYPACQLSHASLDALAAVLPEIDEPILSVTLDVPADSVTVVCEPAGDKRDPRTPYEAKFSLPWSAAALLIDGELGVDSFTPRQLARPELRALAARVAYRPFTADTDVASAAGRAEVLLAGGRVLVGRAVAGRTVGDLAVREKLAGTVGDVGHAKELADVVDALPSLTHLGPLTDLLRFA